MSGSSLVRAIRRTITLPIRGYRRFLSPFTPATCRFQPTCSAYAVEAIEVHGIVRGGWLATRRILRCHPFTEPGLDPVPPGPRASTETDEPDAPSP